MSTATRTKNTQSAVTAAALQPILVFDRHVRGAKPTPRYLLGFGFRRCAAAELAGWTSIRAIVYPEPAERSEIDRLRAIENLQRENLTPVEEALAVAQYLDNLPPHEFTRGQGGKPTQFAIEHVAASLGKDVKWVRDRCYLQRLGEKTRKRIQAGKLLFAHAREIAKLGDHSVQERLADMCEVEEDGSCGMHLEQLRRMVADHQRSLRIVPWKLEADFAGVKDKKILGPCATCPHNSSNDKQLFEHDDTPAEDGFCLHDACYDAKMAASNKAVEKAVATIVHKELPATETTALNVAAEFVKPGKVAREAKRQSSNGEQVPAAEKEETPKPRELTPKEKAEQAFDQAKSEWEIELGKRVEEAAMEKPERVAALIIFDRLLQTPWLLDEKDVTGKGKWAKHVALVARADPDAILELAKLADDDLNMSADLPLAAIEQFAAGWKLDIPPRPQLEDFLPKRADVVDWVKLMKACTTAEQARGLFVQHEQAINVLQRSINLLPTCGRMNNGDVVGFSVVKAKTWKSAVANARKIDPAAADELQSLVDQGTTIHGELWEKLFAAESDFDDDSDDEPADGALDELTEMVGGKAGA